MKNIIKRTAAAALSALVLCGGIPSSLIGIPAFETALTAEAAGTISLKNGVLTLSGNVTRSQILNYKNSYVIKVVASAGTVLPSNCNSLFEAKPVTTQDSEWTNLVSIDLSKADTSNVTSMSRMFYRTYATSIDLSGCDTSNVVTMERMFYDSPNLSTVYVSELWNTDNVGTGDSMFVGCNSLIGWNGTKVSGGGLNYACVDLPGQPGAFTYKGEGMYVHYYDVRNKTTISTEFYPPGTSTWYLPEYDAPYSAYEYFDKWDIGFPGEAQNIMKPGEIFTVNTHWKTYPLVRFLSNGGSGEMPLIPLSVGTTSYTLPYCLFTPPEGKYFVKWDKGYPGNVIAVSESGITVEAEWQSYPFVSFYANGGKGTMSKVTLSADATSYTLPECRFTPPDGYIFDEWDLGKPGDVISVDSFGVTVKAKWKKIPYITFDANGGIGIMDPVKITNGMTAYVLPECNYGHSGNYRFSEWNLGKPGTVVKVDPNGMTIYAQWVQVPMIEFFANGGSGKMSSVVLDIGTTSYTLPQCTFKAPDGYYFDKWEAGETGTVITVSPTIISLKAQWKQYKTVKFLSNGVTGGSMPDDNKAKDTYTVPRCSFYDPNEKLHFVGWEYNGKKVMPGDTITLNSEENTLKALWTDDCAVIQFHDSASFTDYFDTCTNDYYVFPECPLTAPSGKVFAGYRCLNNEIWDPQVHKPGDVFPGEHTQMNDVPFKGTEWWFDVLWADPHNFTVKFSANGGSGTMSNVTVQNDALYTLPECKFKSPAGKEFSYWLADNGTTWGRAGDTVSVKDSIITFVAQWQDKTPEFKTNSMTLGGAISLNFYIDLSGVPEEWRSLSYVDFEVNGQKQTAKFDPNKMNSSKTAYGFTCMLNSVSMADDVKATLHYYDSDGEEQTVTSTSTAETYLNKFNSDDPEKLWNLIKGINDYGYYMQKYLSKAAASPWTLGVDHKAMSTAYTKAPTYQLNRDTYLSEMANLKKEATPSSDIERFNYALSLDSDTSLIVKIKPKSTYKGSISVKVTDASGKTTTVTPVKLSDGRYQITINNISAHKLADMYTVTVKTANGTSTFKASALTYAYEGIQLLSEGDEYNAMCALYEYYKASKAYKG